MTPRIHWPTILVFSGAALLAFAFFLPFMLVEDAGAGGGAQPVTSLHLVLSMAEPWRSLELGDSETFGRLGLVVSAVLIILPFLGGMIGLAAAAVQWFGPGRLWIRILLVWRWLILVHLLLVTMDAFWETAFLSGVGGILALVFLIAGVVALVASGFVRVSPEDPSLLPRQALLTLAAQSAWFLAALVAGLFAPVEPLAEGEAATGTFRWFASAGAIASLLGIGLMMIGVVQLEPGQQLREEAE